MRFVRVNSLTLKVENMLEGDESSFSNRPDYDNWIQSDTANTLDKYDVATETFISPTPYPEDGKIYIWNEETTNWVEVT